MRGLEKSQKDYIITRFFITKVRAENYLRSQIFLYIAKNKPTGVCPYLILGIITATSVSQSYR